MTALREDAGQKGAAKGASRFRLTLATVQIALSMALLAAAGLFVRSLVNVSRVDIGINTDNLMTFSVAPELNGYTPEQACAVRTHRGRTSRAARGDGRERSVGAADRRQQLGQQRQRARVPRRGRTPTRTRISTRSVRSTSAPSAWGWWPVASSRARMPRAAPVAIVNEAFAKKFNLSRDAVGKFISDSVGNNAKLDIEIVGLVQDERQRSETGAAAAYFRPYRQDQRLGFITFYVRSGIGSEQLMPSITSVIARLDANLPVQELKTMDQQVRENVFLDRMISTLSGGFAGLRRCLRQSGVRRPRIHSGTAHA